MPSPARAFSRNSPDNKRLLITAVDGFKGDVRAHYNPKEVTIEKTVTWNEHKANGKNEPYYEYTSGGPRSMTMELFFDVAEVTDNTIEAELEVLQRMTMAVNPTGKDEERRPPLLKVTNGPIKEFSCVIESLNIKVTMFNRNMEPVRATATIKLKELGGGEKGTLKPNGASGSIQHATRPGTNWQAANEADIKKARNDAMADRGNVERARQGKAPISQSERELLDNME